MESVLVPNLEARYLDIIISVLRVSYNLLNTDPRSTYAYLIRTVSHV